MKLTTYTFLFILLLFNSGCNKRNSGYSISQLNDKADSIFQSRISFLEEEAEEDFKNRLPIELKFKVDSLRKVSYDIPLAPVLQEGDSIKMSAYDHPQE